MGSGWGPGKLYYRFLSDSIRTLFYFTPHCLVDVTPWTRRPQKELYERRQRQRRLFSIFSFISWAQQPFSGWGNFPWIQLKCQRVLLEVVFGCEKFRTYIHSRKLIIENDLIYPKESHCGTSLPSMNAVMPVRIRNGHHVLTRGRHDSVR